MQIDEDSRRLSEAIIADESDVPLSNAVVHLDASPSETPLPKLPRISYIRLDLMRWHWSAISGMVFRRSMLDFIMPGNPAAVKAMADRYVVQLCHCMTGSLVFNETLGAQRRYGNDSTPMSGHPSALNRQDATDSETQLAILRLMLDKRDALEATFGARNLRNFVGMLARDLLRHNYSTIDTRVEAVLGRRELARMRWSQAVRGLPRRLASWFPRL
jgi:hypothetical protein